VKKQFFFTEFRQWDRYRRSTSVFFGFPDALWASASGAFHIVGDNLFSYHHQHSIIISSLHHQRRS